MAYLPVLIVFVQYVNLGQATAKVTGEHLGKL